MKLRKPCEHGRYEAHRAYLDPALFPRGNRSIVCPGGEFLADDALIMQRDDDGDWPKNFIGSLVNITSLGRMREYLDALTVRKGAG